MFLSFFTPHADGEQYRYYAIFGGGPISEWTARAFQDIATMTATTPNFRSFVAPGTYHCMIPYPTFYEVESHGVKVVDWITQVVEDKPASSVSCAPDCDAPADAGSP